MNMWTAEKAREAEEAAVRLAAQQGAADDWELDDAPALPPLHLVTGWSKADPRKKPHNPDKALFGGWRMAEMKNSHRSSTSMGARKKEKP